MGTRKFLKGLLLGIGCVSLLAGTFAFASVKPAKPDAVTKKAIFQKVVKLQIPFIENQGQIPDESVRFYAKTFGGTAYVTDKGEIIYSFPSEGSIAAADDYAFRRNQRRYALITKI